MEAKLFNPDGLPVVDPVEQDARLMLVDAKVSPHTLAGRLFVDCWRMCRGAPDTIETSLRVLGVRHPDDSSSNIRKALRILERAGLLSLPHARLAGNFVLGVRRATPNEEGQTTLFDLRAEKQSPCLGLVDAPEPGRAPAVRTDGAHRECAPAVRTASARPASPSDEKKSTPDDPSLQELVAIIERKRAASPVPLARRFLECSNIPTFPSSHLKDVPNVPECSGNVEENQMGQGNVESTEAARFFVRLVERIEQKIGRNETHGWMTYSVALCVVCGALSESQLESAMESTGSWKLFTGAIKNQLSLRPQAKLDEHGLWDAKQSTVQFHRFKAIKRLACKLGITLDESRFRPK